LARATTLLATGLFTLLGCLNPPDREPPGPARSASSSSVSNAPAPSSAARAPTEEAIEGSEEEAEEDARSLRRVDWRNLEYPFHTGEDEWARLEDGAASLSHHYWIGLRDVVFGDLTGDGTEEAVLRLREYDGGSMGLEYVWTEIITLARGRPIVLETLLDGEGDSYSRKGRQGSDARPANHERALVALSFPGSTVGDGACRSWASVEAADVAMGSCKPPHEDPPNGAVAVRQGEGMVALGVLLAVEELEDLE
jgi:hypothetical protein